MHDAFLISAVLSHIVDCLADDGDTVPVQEALPDEDTEKAGRQALAALARTCRTFSELALNPLWRRLDTLQPLMLCVPNKASASHESDAPLVRHFSLEGV